jgi:hypothetical protein
MTDLNCLKESIEGLTKFHQIEILKILKKDTSSTLNENNNGVFVNLTSIQSTIIEDMKNYLSYVSTQEQQLNVVEDEKIVLSTTYFNDDKDNKDNNSICLSEHATSER